MELDGKPATLDDLKALALTNYGHFTSMLVENDRVRGFSLHMQRLRRDCRQLFDADLDTEMVRRYVRAALTGQNQPTVVRVTVYDPALDLGRVGGEARPRVLVTTRAASTATPAPWRLQAVSYQRENPAIKHVGLFGAMKHRRDSQREGFDDVLFLNKDGTVSEIATSNIGFVRDGQIVWPRAVVLGGVTMTLINQELDEPVISEPLALADLKGMEAVFATNAATGVRAIACVDGMEWPSANHPVLAKLRELYAEIPGEVV